MATTLVALVGGTALLTGAESASAHDNTGDAITLTVTDQRVLGLASVTFGELGYRDTSGDGLIDADEIEAQESTVAAGLVDAVRDHVQLTIDGKAAVIIGAGPAPVTDGADPSEYVEVFFATAPHDGTVSEMAVAWSFTSPSEQVVLSSPDGLVTGRLGKAGTTTFSLDTAATVRSFFVTGVDHVRLGLDHLLFLVVLTFAVVGSTVTRAAAWRVLGLVTAFTLGHATSLCLAYFDVVSIPSKWVEPAISLTIVAAAATALRGKGDGIRPWIAAVIGLVHGLGFASSLAGLGLATSHHVGALAAFNVGIDAAQTAAVLAVTVAIWAASKVLRERRDALRNAVCACAVVIGLTWTVTRLAF